MKELSGGVVAQSQGRERNEQTVPPAAESGPAEQKHGGKRRHVPGVREQAQQNSSRNIQVGHGRILSAVIIANTKWGEGVRALRGFARNPRMPPQVFQKSRIVSRSSASGRALRSGHRKRKNS